MDNFELLGEDEIYYGDECVDSSSFPIWTRDLSLLNLEFSNKENYNKYFVPHDVEALTVEQIQKGKESPLCHGLATFKSFEIGRPIGGGFYGVTYIVRHKDLYAAMKIIYKKENRLENIVGEIQNLYKLNHPNIITLYDFFHDTTKIYIVMEYAPGGDLNHAMNYRDFSDEEIRIIFTQGTNAVAECHKHSIIHRDIKLENFVIGKDNNIKLIDFGLSIKVNPGDVIKRYVGTLDYLAPEIVIGSSYDHNVDIWALGVMLYELIYKYSPFEDSSVVITKNNIKYISYTLDNNKISVELRDLIRGIFQPANKRLSIPEIFSHPWISNITP